MMMIHDDGDDPLGFGVPMGTLFSDKPIKGSFALPKSLKVSQLDFESRQVPARTSLAALVRQESLLLCAANRIYDS